MMKRTTLTTKEYSSKEEIPTTQIPSLKPEQYEQLGCGWDFLSQSCKDLFRVGWCQNCFDFGNQIMHDCRCVKVTNFYIQTTSFLGSSAASERLPIPLPEFQQIQPSSPSTDSKYPNNILPPPQQFHPSPQFPPPALFQSNNNSPQQIFFPLNSEFVTNIIPIGLPNFAENSQKELFINQRH
uniref:Uncharacterized protein n=1 Tax=Meloidogyne floridensis TaxID=298350 RepID=A0A915P7X1_9BILA